MTMLSSEYNGALCGTEAISGDKSITHRALLLSAIADNNNRIVNPLIAADTISTIHALQALGVKIQLAENTIHVDGCGRFFMPLKTLINCDNAGTLMRLLAAILVAQPFNSELIGDESLMQRPMQRIIDPLTLMGALIAGKQGHAPLKIMATQTPLRAIDYTMKIASAQLKSSIMLAAMFANGHTRIKQVGFSRDHTERMLAYFDYPIRFDQQQIQLSGAKKLTAKIIHVPGDFSAAAFFIVAATLIKGSKILLKNVGVNPTRMGLLLALQKMGASIRLLNQRQLGLEAVADIEVCSAKLQAQTFNAALTTLMIDEIPILAIAAIMAQGTTKIYGVKELRHKECDRVAAIVTNLNALGIHASCIADCLQIQSGEIQAAKVDSFADHRIAMSFLIAGAVSDAMVKVMNCDCIDISMPDFVRLANQLGMNIKPS